MFSKTDCSDPNNAWEDATDIQDGSFIRISSTFTDNKVDPENQETHTHYLSASIPQSSNTTYFQCVTGGGTIKVRNYNHNHDGYINPFLSHSPTNPLPKHQGFNMCKGKKLFLKQGFVTIFNYTSNLGPGLRAMNEMEGLLPMKHSTFSGTGGSSDHYHSYYADAKIATTPFQTCLVGTENTEIAISDHAHHVSGKTSNSSNTPSNIKLWFVEAETEYAELYKENGNIFILASELPPIGGFFEVVTDPIVLNKFLMGGNSSTHYNSFISSQHFHNTIAWDLPDALGSNSSYLSRVQGGGGSTDLNYGDHSHSITSIICMSGLSPDTLTRAEFILLRMKSNEENGIMLSSLWDWPGENNPTDNNNNGEENGPDENDEPGWLGIPFSTWIPIGAGSVTGIIFLVFFLSCIVILYLILAICLFLCFICIIGSGGGGCCLCFGGTSSCLYFNLKDGTDEEVIELLETGDDRSSIANQMLSWKDFIIPYEKIKLIDKVGKGGSDSIVFKAEYDSKIVALKKFRRFINDVQSFEGFLSESNALLRTSHPLVCRWIGIVNDEKNLGIVMEFGENGDLESYILNNKVKLEQKIYWFYEIGLALKYIHSKNIIHRDLKPKNVLLNYRLEALVCDFGLSKPIEDQNTRGIGTSFYCAPEVKKKNEYGLSADIFSYAYMIYAVCVEEFHNPFDVEFNFYNPLFETKRPDIRPLDKVLGKKYNWIKSIVINGWDLDPALRPSFDEIIELFEQNGIKRDITPKKKEVPDCLKEEEEEEEEGSEGKKKKDEKNEEVRVEVSNIEEHI